MKIKFNKKFVFNRWAIIIFSFTFLLFLIFFLHQKIPQRTALTRILERGYLTMITRNNANCYFNYREKKMGFEYDLIKEFAKSLGVSVRVITGPWEKLFFYLKDGSGDILAANITITSSRQKKALLSKPYMTISQHLILHKNNHFINKLSDLNGKTVTVRKNTSYQERLKELQNKKITLKIHLVDEIPTEELIRQVALKEIELTVANTNIALLNRRYYPDVRIGIPIAEKRFIGWAIKQGEFTLIKRINDFIDKIKATGKYEEIYDKYYRNTEIFDYFDIKKFHRSLITRLPRYRKKIIKVAQANGFDWSLIAAMIYQESHFNPDAISYTGVKGLMQLTTLTANEMGVQDRNNPEQSLLGGVRYLRKLYDRFIEFQGMDRMYIALAAYNVGYGHIKDACEIAKKRNLDFTRWTTIRQILPLLRYRKYNKNTYYGYCRGTEAVRYVSRIRLYYDIIRQYEIMSKQNILLAQSPDTTLN